jgi:tripartite-type tricarboxylate transporter receptor subunit TctC
MPHRVGSNHDGVMRALGKVWLKYLPGTNFVYVNKGQAGGRLAMDQWADSPADGTVIYSFNVTTQSVMYAQQKEQGIDYDWFKVIAPVNTFATDPGAMLVQADSKYQSFNDILEEARKRKVVAAVSRFASADALLLFQIEDATGVDFDFVPFGSGGKTRAALMGGHVDFAVRRAAGVKKSAGKLRAVSLNWSKNNVKELVGDIPTTSEVIGRKLVNAGSYRTIAFHPSFKEKYPERYALLVKTFNKAKNDPEYLAEAKRQGVLITEDTSPEEINDVTRTLIDLYQKYKGTFKE